MAEVSWWRMVGVMLRSRIRSQLQYRTSVITDGLAQSLLFVTEFFELYVLLHRSGVLGGMTMLQVGLVYACASVGFALADLAFGMVEDVAPLVRAGTVETLLVRPTSLLLQVVTGDVQLRRLGRLVAAGLAYPVLLWANHIAWTPAKVVLAVSAPIAGLLVFGAFLIGSGAFQFFVIDGKQAANAIVYGGKTAAQSPGSVLFTPLRVFFTFVAPALFTAWLPMAVVVDAPLTSELRPWLAFLGAPLGLLAFAVALWAWGRGIRHYTGAGG